MNWFKKIFTSKANTSNDAITSQELGEYLFNLCLRHVLSFLDSLDHPAQQKMVKVDREKINQVELLIAFMWVYFDLLQVEKYEKALTKMHTCFMNHMIKCGLQEDEISHIVQMRYDEYRQSHRSQDGIDFTYQKAAHEICKNILDLDIPNTNIFLWFSVSITLQQNILNIGKAIKSMPIMDA